MKILDVVATISLNTAKSAAGAASNWSTCQPKEPEMLKDMSNE
ncbi:MAG: cyclic lactone autoinducer peptide, partial [Clostridia bacterium]|nr:cyclic lactone autoinducer peptide [Clostridia bacterium]